LNKTVATYYRGWVIRITHGVYNFEQMRPMFEFFAAHKDELWGGTFGEVAKYGQERDTATLKVDENTASRIAMTLTDQMLDSRFNYPLTIKVRLPSEWKNVKAAQNGQAVASRVIEHEGALYALVHAVPDRGQIVLAPASL
jgi:chitin deacetylase